jgi:hypothetical protein
LGDPPPRSARDVLERGSERTFVVQALDPPRRGIELALPDVAKVSGTPTDETVEAEIEAAAPPLPAKRAAKKKAAKKKEPAAKVAEPKKAAATKKAPATKKAAATKKTAKKVAAPKKAAAKKAAKKKA